MTNYEKQDAQSDFNNLQSKIESLENRLTSIEKLLRIEWIEKSGEKKIEIKDPKAHPSSDNESTIVEQGLAWLGSIVLIFGIIFLMTFLDGAGYSVMSKVVSYLASATLIVLAYYFRKSFPILVNILTYCIPLLVYYITLNLHYFSEEPIFSSKYLVLIFLLALVAGQYLIAIKIDKEFLGTIALLLLITTAVAADATYITLSLLLVSACISVILFYRILWWKLMLLSLFMVYMAHLIWLFSNPIMGNPMRIVESHQNNILFLFGYGIIYASSLFISNNKLKSNGILISITIWNAIMFSFVLLMVSIPFYQETYGIICGAIALFCILFSVFLKIKTSRKFAPATYACFGFMALSISVYGFSGLPTAYFLLVLQSFLVVSMALWFRSKIIVIANSFLFVTILLLYLMTSTHTILINFAFAATALATARILNWKKERLTLKTEVFRNVFLFVAFLMILYSFSFALPDHLVTLSWTGVAIGFFILSLALRNIKYRYMSILTILVTGGHLFFIDLRQMEIGYRVIAFMVFAVISLGVSLYYSKSIRKKTSSIE